jgi:uncharacterized MnhB-related membrane protein
MFTSIIAIQLLRLCERAKEKKPFYMHILMFMIPVVAFFLVDQSIAHRAWIFFSLLVLSLLLHFVIVAARGDWCQAILKSMLFNHMKNTHFVEPQEWIDVMESPTHHKEWLNAKCKYFNNNRIIDFMITSNNIETRNY